MTLKIHPILMAVFAIAIILLLIALFKGCNKSAKETIAKEKALVLADSALSAIKEYKTKSDSSAKLFQDTIEFERGQNALADAQKQRTELELDHALAENSALIRKYKMHQYTDTSAVLAPAEFISDCHDCFVKLERDSVVIGRYKNDINNIQANWDRQTEIYQKRFKEINKERLGFYNKINSLEKQQKEAADNLEPHGRLYLSWGVLWRPWPVAAGAGLMYQNKRNLIWGAKAYYGQQGTTVETTINFPLSLKKR